MHKLTWEQITEARYNWYKVMGHPHDQRGFWDHISDEYDQSIAGRDDYYVPEPLHDYIMALASPHFYTLMKARSCRKSPKS